MSTLDDLISEIADENLRGRIEREVAALKRTKKFGLVFEPQNPECTPLYDVSVKRKSLVALKAGKLDEFYRVTQIVDNAATCIRLADGAEVSFEVDKLISVAQFGEAIYPCLQQLDAVSNAPDSELWHALIEADNYHALQLLRYLYGGKVDCIYIDPPYNTGARDWKYNNDYVDASNEYRHSKWLSMMERRLKLAKELLNPRDSVLIVTVDEHEYLHLGCLLEEIFRGARIQMVSSVINPSGVSRGNEFYRTDEYIFFVKLGNAAPAALTLDDEWITARSTGKDKLRWRPIRRQGADDTRRDAPNQFFPIFLTADGKHFAGAGETLPLNLSWKDFVAPADKIAVFPLKPDGTEGRWQISQQTFAELCRRGYTKISYTKKWGYVPQYLAEGERKKVERGQFPITGRAEDGSIITAEAVEAAPFIPGTQWRIHSHSAREFGGALVNAIIGGGRFAFPKSLYAVHDALKFFVANKPDALIVDFFAGSGTTLHAVNLLNAEDDGKRRCILVTNNEVSDAEEKNLRKQGFTPANIEWQRLGVARYVTWQRTRCTIEGHDINGAPLKGNYLGADFPMADGFKANAAFFKLGFLDKDSVALGRQFKELLPVLWFKAGCRGKCPTLEKNLPPMMILPDNHFAVLLDEKFFSDFEREVLDCAAVDTIFIITDSDYGYHAMIKNFAGKATYRLYRDYLENFKISG